MTEEEQDAHENQADPQLKIIFEGELGKKFQAIKHYYGIKNNTDTIRLIVTLTYKELKEKGHI